MKIEVNKKIINQLFKKDEMKKIISKGNINKSYYILLVFMVALASTNIYKNINNDYENSILKSEVATVFSNSEESLPNENNSELLKITNDMQYFTQKQNILSSEYTDGISKFEIDGKKDIYSICDGIVENIYIDYCYGYTVVINNKNNIRIKYCNLDSDIKLNIGDDVKKGDIIGNTIKYNLIDSSYIYIMMYYNNESINIINLFEM